MVNEAKPFKEMLFVESKEPTQYQPRNVRQTTYFKSLASSTGKIGKDEFVTVHELAYMLPGFIWTISTYPDLVLTCGLPFMLDFLCSSSPVFLSYDTTFNLGDFYVSALVVQTSVFSELPIFPVGFVVHDRKFETVHAEFFMQLKKKLSPCFAPVIVTDGEIAVGKAIKTALPHWKLVSCWNHILTDVEMWLKKRHISSQEVAIYKSTVRELLCCDTADEFEVKLATVQSSWSEAFCDYFNSFLLQRLQIACKYHLLSVGASLESVTNNISESFNNVLKHHLAWEESPVDVIVLALYKLQIVYRAQILRSVDGFGPFTRDQLIQCGLLLPSSFMVCCCYAMWLLLMANISAHLPMGRNTVSLISGQLRTTVC
jgi:hypothetical protein